MNRQPAKCKRCGATITWARTAATGAAMPLDPGANPDGNCYIDRGGLVIVLGKDDPERTLDKHVLLQSHWATCPKAKEAKT